MFVDLEQENRKVVEAKQAKAYPSVNSLNDGSFNSEHNMRWFTKSLTTKPFVVGQEDETVNRSFEKIDDVLNSGMVGIDGYTIKLSTADTISFDNKTFVPLIKLNTEYAQRFISDLTQELNNDISGILFSEYNVYGSVTAEKAMENLEIAYIQNTCIGYAYLQYADDYYTALVSAGSTSSIVKYGDKEIPVVNFTSNPPDVSDSADLIRQKIANASITGLEIGSEFAIKDGSKYNIFYPLFITNSDMWNESTQSYDELQTIQFVDIFGIPFQYDTKPIKTKMYPTNDSRYLNMFGDANTNYALGDFATCQRASYPVHLYDYGALYSGSTRSNTKFLFDAGQETLTYEHITTPSMPSSGVSTIFSTYFEPHTTAELLSDYIPDNGEVELVDIDNNVTYYCIPNIDSSEHLQVSNQGNINDVPIAFMTSSGTLCPDGLLVDSDKMRRYPVEGYIHYLKRMRLRDGNRLSDNQITEDMIDAVTIDELISWGDFRIYYAKIINQISIYMQLAYSGLIDYILVYGAEINPLYKANGCGNALISAGAATDDGFYAVMPPYGASCFTVNNGAYSSSTTPVTMKYHKDTASDTSRITQMVFGSTITSDSLSFEFFNSHFNRAAYLGTFNNVAAYEDPINYLKGCTTYTQAPRSVKGSLTFSRFNNSSNFVSAYEVSAANYLVLDELLMPTKAKNPIDDYINPNTFGFELGTQMALNPNGVGYSYSIGNGMCFIYNVMTWRAKLSYVLSVDKDTYNYLRGKDFSEPSMYDGVKFGYKLPNEMTDKDLYLFGLDIDIIESVGGNDTEQYASATDTLSKYSKVRREAFLHVNKIYGKDFMTIEDIIKALIKKNIGDVNGEIEDINDNEEIIQETRNNDYDNAAQLRRAILFSITDTANPEPIEYKEQISTESTYTVAHPPVSSEKELVIQTANGYRLTGSRTGDIKHGSDTVGSIDYTTGAISCTVDLTDSYITYSTIDTSETATYEGFTDLDNNRYRVLSFSADTKATATEIELLWNTEAKIIIGADTYTCYVGKVPCNYIDVYSHTFNINGALIKTYAYGDGSSSTRFDTTKDIAYLYDTNDNRVGNLNYATGEVLIFKDFIDNEASLTVNTTVLTAPAETLPEYMSYLPYYPYSFGTLTITTPSITATDNGIGDIKDGDTYVGVIDEYGNYFISDPYFVEGSTVATYGYERKSVKLYVDFYDRVPTTKKIEIPFEYAYNKANMFCNCNAIPHASSAIRESITDYDIRPYIEKGASADANAWNIVIPITNHGKSLAGNMPILSYIRFALYTTDSNFRPAFLLILNPNGGECDTKYCKILNSETYDTAYFGETYATGIWLFSIVPERPGYQFDGWTTEKDNIHTLIDLHNDTFTDFKNKEIFAHWTLIPVNE